MSQEKAASLVLRESVDYGFGTFKGEPLVICTMGGGFHRSTHNGRYRGVTFTESFAADNWRRCRICWRTPTQDNTDSPGSNDVSG